jgi:hypothetical protein
MEKIVEALSKLLPEDQVSEVTEAIKSELESAKQEMDKEYTKKLEEAYEQLHGELKNAEETGYQGYQEAHAIIKELRNRLEMQKAESTSAQSEGYEEAYQMLLAEKQKNENLEVEMYEQFNEKLKEMREYMVDKVHQFLEFKGQEIYEQARRDVVNDPRMADHKVTLDKIVDNVANYLSDDDYNTVCSSKLEEADQKAEDLKGQVRILEARNIRLSGDNDKLNETVRQAQHVITESSQDEKKARKEKAQQVTGRGESADVTSEQVIGEWSNPKGKVKAKRKEADTSLVETVSEDQLDEWAVLAGTKTAE